MIAPRSLRTLTLTFLLVLTIATVGTGVTIYTLTSRTIVRLVDARIAAAADVVAPDGPAPDTATMLSRIRILDEDRDTGDIGIMLTDPGGRSLGGNITLSRHLRPGFSTLRIDDRIKGLTQGRAFVRELADHRRLTVIAETEPFDDYSAVRLRIYAAGFGAILLVVLGGMALFARLVGDRIAAIRETADAIIRGDMRHRVPIHGDGGAFDGQAAAFNRMLDRIADLMRSMADVSSDIAHDLRTPLARLRSQLETLVRSAETDATRERAEQALAQCDELLAMFAAILRIAEVEGGDRRAGFEPMDLAAFADDIATMMAPVVEDAGHIIAIDPGPPLTIRGDPQLLTQLFINLIENALRHTPSGSHIQVTVRRHGENAVVTVSDDGPGIPVDRRKTALRRFGRLDPSRAADADDGTAGHGLGLALVEAIVRLHEGDMRLEDATPGLRVVMELPAGENNPARA